jgi:ketosteroid isomerase-like protein
VSQNAELIRRFYSAFQKRDAEGMVACYAPDVRFSDPVFPDLVGDRAKGMWRMLCARGKDLRIEFRDVSADETSGRAHWEAWYTFTTTGNPVHNIIDAEFRFANGLIVEHRDRFHLYRWSRQALGATGLLLGWTPIVQGKVRRQAARALDSYLTKT